MSLSPLVDGGFSTWSEFGSCSKSCGGGIETRHRKCNNPKPQNGGKNCAGALSESRSCNNELCPGKCCDHFLVFPTQVVGALKYKFTVLTEIKKARKKEISKERKKERKKER